MSPRVHPSPAQPGPRRRPVSGRISEDIVTCRLKVVFPRAMWMQRFTTAHPSLRMEVLDRLEVGRGQVLYTVVLSSHEKVDWAKELLRFRGIRDVERISTQELSGTYRVLYSGWTFLPLIKRAKLPRQYPFTVQNGVATWTLVGSEGKVRALLKELEASQITVSVEAIRRGNITRTAPELTARQTEILERAIEEGYFEVPRRISLINLAARVGVAASTLSVTLAVIERKIVEAHLRRQV